MPLITHVSTRVLRFLLKRTSGDYEAASEVLQETFLAALKSYQTFKHKSSYFTWLCKISLNKLSDYYRDQINEHSKIIVPSIEIFNQLVDPKVSMEEKLSLDELRGQVNACLDMLPDKYRRLLQMKYYEELSTDAICSLLGISPRRVEGRLYRARKAFAKVYQEKREKIS